MLKCYFNCRDLAASMPVRVSAVLMTVISVAFMIIDPHYTVNILHSLKSMRRRIQEAGKTSIMRNFVLPGRKPTGRVRQGRSVSWTFGCPCFLL
jgi:hypothetical protein